MTPNPLLRKTCDFCSLKPLVCELVCMCVCVVRVCVEWGGGGRGRAKTPVASSLDTAEKLLPTELYFMVERLRLYLV